jgi:dihydrofolate reductase
MRPRKRRCDHRHTAGADRSGPALPTGRPLLASGLVDELRLFVHPVVLGGGSRLLPDLTERQALDLVGTRTFPPGVVHLHYRARR